VNVETVALLVVFGLGAAWSVHLERHRRAALRTYWTRSCAGRAWREAFPDQPKDAIREFLYFVVDEFGFERRRALQLAPADTLLGLYMACYPDKSAPDAMEVESLFRTLSARYKGERFAEVSDAVTLGDLFRRACGVRPNTSFERTREG
jgi:propanediol dehydratase small subunit